MFQSAFGKPAYKGVYDRAAALMQKVAATHAFLDGNKRTALQLTVAYLRASEILVIPPYPEAGARLVSELVVGTHDVRYVAAQLREWTVPDSAAIRHRQKRL